MSLTRVADPLTESEQRLAQVTAQVIVRAAEAGLLDSPDKLVAPGSIQLLARAHLELLSKVESFDEAALQDQGKRVQERLDQIAREAINGALRELARQQGGVASKQIIAEATSDGLLAAKPFICAYVEALPKKRRRVLPHDGATKLRVAHSRPLSSDELCAIYCRIMGETCEVFDAHPSYIVRHWDGMDGCWTDCTGEVARDEALCYWADKTDGGTRNASYDEIDYYRIFPGGTRMHWDGSEGREMHR